MMQNAVNESFWDAQGVEIEAKQVFSSGARLWCAVSGARLWCAKLVRVLVRGKQILLYNNVMVLLNASGTMPHTIRFSFRDCMVAAWHLESP